ncbi:MAG: CapA family protein [Christensenellales bacterium]|jgi:poly-gamma-glutamate capsule biosynthesis protein CapA/YwtB (metallophosphatase superfamily)
MRIKRLLALLLALMIVALPSFALAAAVRVKAVGDIMCFTTQIGLAKTSSGYNFNRFFNDITPVLSDADLTIGNLETPVSSTSKFAATSNPTFNAPKEFLSALKEAGFDMVSTANNHSFDCRLEGLYETLDALDSYGIAYSGTARNRAEKETPLIIEKEGISFGFTAWSQHDNGNSHYAPSDIRKDVFNRLSADGVREDVVRLRNGGADIVIALVHWDKEHQNAPTAATRAMATTLFRNGVDIMLGAHSHCLQPVEMRTMTDIDGRVSRRLVAYSLGNFISNMGGINVETAMILNLEFEKHFDYVDLTGATYTPTTFYRGRNANGSPAHRLFALGSEQVNADPPLSNQAASWFRNARNHAINIIGNDVIQLSEN